MRFLSFIDYLVIGAYLAAVAAIGIRAARRQKTTSEYFIANRRIPAFAVGFTLMATTISSTTFVAIPGSVFAKNWWQMFYMSTAILVLFFVVAFVVPFYRRVVGMSAYEYLERRFGYAARLYGSAGFVILRVTDLGFTLYLTAVAMEVISGWDIQTVVVAVGLFTLAYTLIGGIEASIWTSVIQGVLLIGGAAVILFTIFFVSGLGVSEILSDAVQAGKFEVGNLELSWQSLYFEEPTAWIYFLAGLMYFGRYYTTEQNMVQRYLVARTDADAKRGVTLGILSTVPTWFVFGLIGSCLWSFYHLTAENLPSHVTDRPDTILPFFIATHLPSGLIGLILAALLSSAMSSVSADLNSIATVATKDHFLRVRPEASDRVQLAFGRLAVLVGGIISTAAALVLTLTRSTAAYEIVALAVSIIAGGMLGLFALGFLSERATRFGANAGIVACLVYVTWATVTGPIGVDLGFNFRMHPILIGVFSHFVLFAVGYAASVAFGGHRPELTGLTIWNKESTGSFAQDPANRTPEEQA